MASQAVSSEASNDMGLDTDVSERKIVLVSNDGLHCEIVARYALLSKVIKTSLETDLNATELPLTGINGEVLKHIVKYLEHHQGLEPSVPEKPLRSKIMKEVCVGHEWDADFLEEIWKQKGKQQLYNVVLGANYLDIKPLLHLGCAMIAAQIKGVPLSKIKDILDPNKPIVESPTPTPTPTPAPAPMATEVDDSKSQ